MTYFSYRTQDREADRNRSVDRCRNHHNYSIYFGDVQSRDFGIYVTGLRVTNSPKRDVSFVSVPGRNGDLVMDNKRWCNVDVTYSFAITTKFAEKFDMFKSAILSQTGYQRLSDDIYPGLFRLAMVQKSIQPEIMRKNRTGKFDVTFHSKPQRYLESGERKHSFSAPGELHNGYDCFPIEGFPAKPLITVYGTGAGTVTIGDVTVDIKEMTDQLILDCENQNAYRQVGDGAPENMNNSIYAPEFPELVEEVTPISFSGGVTEIEIIPRWWTL